VHASSSITIAPARSSRDIASTGQASAQAGSSQCLHVTGSYEPSPGSYSTLIRASAGLKTP
jgi:hypothetical protein